MNGIKIFSYGKEDLALLDFPNHLSSECFDDHLKTSWISKRDELESVFRYKLDSDSLPFKILPGKYSFLLQLNPDRAQKRRKAQDISNMNEPFDPTRFNFNMIPEREILFKLKPDWCGGESDHFLVVNVSPLEFGHSLLVPSRGNCNPQRCSEDGLRLALEAILLSREKDLRVGFNSLCGYASVNHEHYHIYYLKTRMYLEDAELSHLAPTNAKDPSHIPVFQLVDYPAPAFVFVLEKIEDLQRFVNRVVQMTGFLQRVEIAHNIFITRRKDGSVGLFLWTRESSFGAKQTFGFNPALCELGGHFPCKTTEAYEELTEEKIIDIHRKLCIAKFNVVKKAITEDNSIFV